MVCGYYGVSPLWCITIVGITVYHHCSIVLVPELGRTMYSVDPRLCMELLLSYDSRQKSRTELREES